jgi:hypothetical protein
LVLAAISLVVGSSRDTSVRPGDFWALDSASAGAALKSVLAIGLVALMLLGVALWNGFPLVYYDTGAYLVEGLQGAFLVERSPVYSLFLAATGSAWSLWPVVILQSLLTVCLLWEVARIEVPGLTPLGFCGIGAGLTLLTGVAWYAGQVEPDCMTALLVLGAYLLLFRRGQLGVARTRVVIAITSLAIACHPSHLGLMGGLILCAWGWQIFTRINPLNLTDLPKVRLLPALWALLLALSLIVAGNFALARGIFISRSGPVFLFARLMQDGIVKRLLDDRCTGPETPYKLCVYKNHLAPTANGWLWGNNPGFRAQGGFPGSHQEDSRIILDSLERYPFMQVRAAIYDSVLQFFMFRTGDGIESQQWVLRPEIRSLMPRQLHAYLQARQQHNAIRFRDLNMLHVTVGMLSLLGVLLLINHAVIRRRWDEAVLPGLVMLALVGNAIICATFSNPHDRYQSRLIWVPNLILLLALARDPRALQPAEAKD